MALVLVIDDETGMRRIVRRMLEEAGHRVMEAQDGKVGFRAFREHRPELVIVDIFMPEQEGIETIRKLRKQSPEISIIATSGGGAYGLNLLDGLELLGADRTLSKPFRKDELLGAVEQLLAA
jgi:two-component system response regulator (stage 0 sporulation protein F)